MPEPEGWLRSGDGLARGFLIVTIGLMASSLAWTSVDERPEPKVMPKLVVDANSAPLPVLQALPGIGPVLAGRIVEAREAAPFRSMADLDRRVKGIGPVTAAALKPFLRFDGE